MPGMVSTIYFSSPRSIVQHGFLRAHGNQWSELELASFQLCRAGFPLLGSLLYSVPQRLGEVWGAITALGGGEILFADGLGDCYRLTNNQRSYSHIVTR